MDKNTNNLYASDSVQRNFPWLADAIDDLAPNTNIMVISKSDVYIPPVSDSHSTLWGAKEDWSRLDSNGSINTREDVDFWDKFNKTKDNIMQLIGKHSAGEHPFIPKNDLTNALINNHSDVANTIYGAASTTLKQRYSASFLPAIMGVTTPSCIVTVPEKLQAPTQEASSYAGIDSRYLNDITGTSQDWAVFVIGHEIGGHCHNGHHYSDNSKYDSIEINLTNIDNGAAHETQADIKGANFYYKMQEKGIATSSDIPAQVEHMRSIGNLLNNSNNYTTINNEHISEHVTTIKFDPAQKNATSQFNVASMSSVSALPLAINSYADALIGFTYAQYIKNGIENGTFSELNADDIEFFEKLTKKPSEIFSQLEDFAKLGQDLRFQNPEMQYAAIKFLHENNAFDSLKERLKPEYGMALDDLVQDYLEAVDTHAHALKDTDKVDEFKTIFSNQIDFTDITDITLITHDYPTAQPDRIELDIKATLPAQGIIPAHGVTPN